jgi:hypothetical protein
LDKGQDIEKTREKVYQGDRSLNDWTLKKVTVNGKPLRHIKRHSEDLEWGYCGSGCADLSLSILTDYLGDRCKADQFYQQFKFDIISGLAYEGWEIKGSEIDEWLKKEG